MSRDNRRGMTLEELQPDYEDLSKQPQTLTKTRHIDGILHVAGRRPTEQETYDIMCVTPSIEEEEASTHSVSTFGHRVPIPAEYLKGANGVVKDVALRAGVDLDKCYYTALCKWLLPRTQRNSPPKKIKSWGMPILEDEIRRVKPKIIVCLGKPVFDMLCDQKIKFADAHGCWFWSERYEAHLYVMHAPRTLVMNPEHYETFRIDFKEVARRKELLDQGGKITGKPFNYHVIRDQESLEEWLDHLENLAMHHREFGGEDAWPGYRDDDGNPLLAVDCEWHGKTHIDGKLRTMQVAWSEHDAVVIEFRDEKTEWSFDFGDIADDARAQVLLGEPQLTPDRPRYAWVGRPIAKTFDRMNVRYIGHHYAADAPWMKHWLGIEVYQRCALDTEFAQQTVDESSELGLERGIAMKYTNLGRYDQDLTMWKRDNKKLCEDGYGFIPSSILIPYSCADVIAPLRAYPMIKRQMHAQRLWEYYRDIFNPFVTDVFTEFCMTGLPMDIPTMDDLRDLFSWARDELAVKLQERIFDEAKAKMRSWIATEFGIPALMEIAGSIEEADEEAVKSGIKQLLADKEAMKEVPKWNKRVTHLCNAPKFNIRSPDQMASWLFDFEELTPIKSTNQKAKGLPSMAWEKVLELPKDRQALYKPAVDKQTLEILSHELSTIDQLLDLNAVGNLAKAFLKEADVFEDPITGEEVREEHGLHAWLATDGYIHGQMSATETGRPRSWAPNTLNWPSYVNKRISRTIERLIRESHEEGDLPDHLMKWIGVPGEDIPSIRSCVKAPEGYVLVESDYATAEMVALWKVSGCEGLGRILGEPDPEWALLKPGNKYEVDSVRVSFADVKMTGIPEEARSEKFIMHVWENGDCKGPVDPEELLRDDDGNLVHAKYDIHWSLIERTYGKFREMMNAKVDRAAAKVLNFSSAYGATANSLERKIESDTGVKPEEGTGERGLEAISERQPRATEFLEEMAQVPKTKGMYRAASGRIRHCIMHAAGAGVGWRTRNSIESALGREMRNFPMQESVGATSARACRMLLRAYGKLGLKAKPMTCLYDSVVTLCPIEERFLVARLHQLCMSDLNTWEYEDELGKRTLQYDIDVDFVWRWSTKTTKEEKTQLWDRTWCPPPAKYDFLESHENLAALVS